MDCSHTIKFKVSLGTVSEFDELYKQEETYDPVNDKHYICAPFAYDSIWIAALALNCTENHLRETGKYPM